MDKKISKKQLRFYLKKKRRQIAEREKLELYMIFHNSVLEEIAMIHPKTKDDLKNISGFGNKKIEKYGDELLKFIQNPLAELRKEKRIQKIKNIYPKIARVKIKLKRKITPAELKFKSYLDELGIEYCFQKAITIRKLSGFRVVDFYIPRAKLVFEIDGGYHNNINQEIKDAKRIDEIHRRRPRLLFVRFSNNEVLKEPVRIKSTVLEIFNGRYKPAKTRDGDADIKRTKHKVKKVVPQDPDYLEDWRV